MVHHKQSSCRRVSLPYREDAWHQSGSSEWPRPQLQRSAGWSQGWQTGIRNKHRRCVTLCMSYMTRSDYLNVQYNQNLASHHWWSFNKIHIVLHYFKAISAQHYFARRLRFEVTAFHSHWDYFKHVWCLEPKLSTSHRWNSKEKIKQTGALIPKCHSTNCVWCSIIKVLNQSWGNDCFALCKWIICPCCGYLSSLHHIHI